MKKSYKLLGVFWDKLETTDNISLTKNNEFISNIDDDYNIFDFNNTRKINISDILKTENENDLNQLIKKMQKYDVIVIDMDYIPSNNNIILNNLFTKRVNQIYNYFSSKLNKTKIYLSSNIEKQFNK